jgi:hypothetical protein
MPGKAEVRAINPLVATNVVTFGEELQLVVTYMRGVPRNGSIWRVPTTPQPTPDAMRPQGDLGTTDVLDVTTNGGR